MAVVSVIIVPDVSVDVIIVPDVSVMVPDPIDAVSVDIADVSVPAVSTLVFSSREHAKPNSVNAATIKSAVSFFMRVLSSGNDYLESGLSIVTFSEGAGITTFRIFGRSSSTVGNLSGIRGDGCLVESARPRGQISNCSATGTHPVYVPVAVTVQAAKSDFFNLLFLMDMGRDSPGMGAR